MTKSQNILLVGPDPSGLGGIETVVRTYLDQELEDLEIRNLATWDKTVPGERRRLLWPKALISFLATAREHRKRATIVHAHISHNGSFIREGSFILVARILGLRSRLTIHGSAFVSSSESSVLKRYIYSAVLRCADRTAVLNDVSARTARSLGARNVVTLPNPGPVRTNLNHTPAGANPPHVVFAGSVGRRKGVDVLLSAWPQVLASLPEATLEVYGPEGDADIVAALGDYWKGPVSPDVIWTALKRCRVAVLPSTAEAMPMFVMEALGHGRPVVVTDVGAMAAQAAGCGRVVPVGDVGGLAQALLAYLASPEAATADGNAGLAIYRNNYNTATLDSSLQEFYSFESNTQEK